jgi:hypothetical protein
MKKYIFSGCHVILDEALINSDNSYSIFQHCCDHYPHIRKVLLFDTIEGNYNKLVTRNIKFTELLSQQDLEKSVAQIIKEIEIASGGSSKTYRLPKEIIENYKEYYTFQHQLGKNDIALGEVTQRVLESVITRISIDQLKILGLLSYRGESVTRDFVEVQQEIQSIFGVHSKVYIVSKTIPDYITPAARILDLKLLDNSLFISNLLQDVLLWLNVTISTNALEYEESNEVLVTTIGKYDFVPTCSEIKHRLDCELNNKYKTIILNNFQDIIQLDRAAKILINESFTGKIMIVLFGSPDNSMSGLVVRNVSYNKIECIYYNSKLERLENNSEGLILLLFLRLYIQGLELKDSIMAIKDLSRQLSEDFDYNNWYGFIKLSKNIECSLNDSIKEWSLWSKCFGKVILINGVSCSGKTTLVNYLEQVGFDKIVVDEIYHAHYRSYLNTIVPELISEVKSFLSINDFWKILFQFKVDVSKYSASEQESIDALKVYWTDLSRQIFINFVSLFICRL